MPVAGCPKLNVGSQEKKRGVPCLSVEEGNKQVEATDALVIQLTPCCQSVLAVMLAKAGVSVGFTYYWI